MKKLHFLLIKSFLGPLILTFFMVIFILLMQFLWKYIDELVGKGLEFNVLAEFLLYSSASMVTMALPLAVLLSSLMTFGNLAENLELLAFKSSGVSLTRIMSPLFLVVIILTIGTFFFANTIMPIANLKLKSLMFDIRKQSPEMQIQPGVFDNTMEGYSIRIGDHNTKTRLLKDIWIYDHTDKAGNLSVTVADSGYMKMSNDEKRIVLTLFNGNSYVELDKSRRRKKESNYPHRRDKFAKQEMLIKMPGGGLKRSDQNLWKNSFSMMNLSQLNYHEDSIQEHIVKLENSMENLIEKTTINKNKKVLVKTKSSFDSTKLAALEPQYHKILFDTVFNKMNFNEKRRTINQAINFARSNKSLLTTNTNTIIHRTKILRRYQIEKHRKFTLSLSCLIFFFIGAPLGAIIRKGGLGMPVIVSVLFFLIWYMVSITGEKFVREDMTSPFIGMWISSFILVPLGIFLSYKASRDSVILNIESYFTFFKKFGTFIKKQLPRI